jgi:collagenase-like PrtC family protease
MHDLYNCGVDTIRIDSFLHDDEWTYKTAKVYLKAIEQINNAPFIKTLLKELPPDKYSHGFYLMSKDDLIYLKQNEGIYE